MEIFVIYNKLTGLIEGGAGRIDREWDAKNKDGSTISERIPQILAKDLNRAVIYFPDQDLPNPEKHKIVEGKIVELAETDKQPAIKAKLNDAKIQARIRELAIESLKASDSEFPRDYK